VRNEAQEQQVDSGCGSVNENDPTPTSSHEQWLTEKQLSEHLQVSVRHLVNLRAAGLPFVQLGSAVRYSLAEVEEYLRRNRRLSSHVARQRRRKALAAK
jgi:hypothetical protein